ncbi:MAG: tRNA lysidine(34) synthetase TilS [Minwuia sp.]|nr:tRNA lysidine(34) synthetase TilS [Minwuia sp.]
MTELRAHFDQAMRGLPDPGRALAVAVSGGPDSMALVTLLRDWATTSARDLTALIVDHGLRRNSNDEAARVAARLRSMGITARVLIWDGNKPTTGIQAAARDARYRLMLDWCRAHGVSSLFLGHHADDQAATVAMRIDHGSGIDGLAAMRRVAPRVMPGGTVHLFRPLLDTPKSALLAFLQDQDVAWEEDPTNRDPRYERNRTNAAIADHPNRERHSARLHQLSHRAARAADALSHMTDSVWQVHARSGTCGGVQIDLSAFAVVPEEIRLRLLIRAVTQAGGIEPGLSAAERALDRISASGALTLGHAVIRHIDGELVITRERRNLPRLSWPAAARVLEWDGRFRLEASSDITQSLTVGPGSAEDALLPCLYLEQTLLGCPLTGPVALPGDVNVRAMPLHLLSA